MQPDDLRRENEALRVRIAALNAAILRINASLDLETVLAEVTESTRALTGARWGGDANLVRIFVRNLRRKLGDDAANPAWIFNERGVGYRMAEPGSG